MKEKIKNWFFKIDHVLDMIMFIVSVVLICVSTVAFVVWGATGTETAFRIAVTAGVIGLILDNFNPVSFEYRLLKTVNRIEIEDEYDDDDDDDEYDEDEYPDSDPDNDPDTTTNPGLYSGKH